MKNYPRFQKTLLALSVGALLTGCYGEQDNDHTSIRTDSSVQEVSSKKLWSASRVQSAITAETSSCANGGVTINAGFDLNDNGILDSEEVDQTQTLCHGADAQISADVIAEGTTECNGAGGTRLTVGTSNPILICNAGEGAAAYDFAKAKQLAQGLGTWITSLETYADDVAQTVNEQSTQIEALISTDGVDASVKAVGYLIQSVEKAVDLYGEDADFSQDVSTLFTPLPSDLISLSGTINYVATTRTISVTGFSAGVLPYGQTPALTTTVTLDSIVLPEQSIAAGGTFELTLNNIQAIAAGGQVTIPSGQASVTVANAVDRSATTDQDPGEMSISLNLGSEAAPVRLETTGTDYGTGIDKGEIVFEGSFTANLTTYQYGFTGLGQETDISSITGAAFNGSLSYDGQTASVALAVDAPQVTKYDTSDLEAKYPSLATGNIMTGAYRVIATDKTSELIYTQYPFYDDSIVNIVEYDYSRIGDHGMAYVVSYDHSLSDGVADYYELYVNRNGYNDYYSSSSSIGFIEGYVIDTVFGYIDSFDYGFNNYYDSVGDITYLNVSGESLSVRGTVPGQLTLPSIGMQASYDMTIEQIEYEKSYSTFDNHGLYVVTAQVDLSSIKDSTGAALADTSIGVKAERYGYSYSLGDIQFYLSHAGQSFSANYFHSDLTDNNQYWGEPVLRWEPKKFSFTDGSGGLVTMSQFGGNVSSGCLEYGESWNNDNRNIACILGSGIFDININGRKHGRMYQDYKGDLIVVYTDGENGAYGTEERVYTRQ